MCDIKRRKVAKEVVKKLIAAKTIKDEDYKDVMDWLYMSGGIEFIIAKDEIEEVHYSWKKSNTGFGKLTVINLEDS